MQFKDLPVGATFTIEGYKAYEGEAIIANKEEYIAPHVEVTPVYKSLKPFSKIRLKGCETEGQYLRDNYVYWDNNKWPSTLSKPATTEFYEQC